jgi:hypothetical protein
MRKEGTFVSRSLPQEHRRTPQAKKIVERAANRADSRNRLGKPDNEMNHEME